MSKDATEIYDVVPVFAVDESGKALITEEQYSWLCNYAVRKAERVEELEKERSYWKGKYSISKNKYRAFEIVLEEHIDRLENKNKRYRELLEKIKEMTRYDDCREAEIYELVSDELEGDLE